MQTDNFSSNHIIVGSGIPQSLTDNIIFFFLKKGKTIANLYFFCVFHKNKNTFFFFFWCVWGEKKHKMSQL